MASQRTAVVIEEAQDECGVKMSRLAKEVGVAPTTFYNVRRGKFELAAPRARSLRMAIRRRGKRLVEFDPKREDLIDVLDEVGVGIAFIARSVGISSQAVIWGVKTGGIADSTLDEIYATVRGIGKRLLRISK